ncbi:MULTISPECIES: periplasmic flagellar collar protein FlcA [unclassified Treponema]|uniref:periplasmic flagellar collar protein FlcA n=1 Tax=unclassified Treponema TaxID=2638727 RepID=UPI0020A3DB98|nr:MULTISPECIES: tetratricopeptide repeat protein [unclassified Treponema]UTC65943.1 tetratricopeptide repeat protein [Treponema sp. OMZ 789]UTC68671.1 tetratricopeptide repeat protein [Treponema sp. OMZ 790]UTC71401.1 tetratricopeptide repeat protein [Treponema sp. OMZ 791]
MPSIKELEKFKSQLLKIANEPEVTAKWGERREEIPLPKEVPVPDVNVDDLLNFKTQDQISPDQEADKEAEFDTASIITSEMTLPSEDEPGETSQDFDTMLSDLNLEDTDIPEAVDSLDDDGLDVPEALLSGIGDMVEEARNSDDKADDIFPDFDSNFAMQDLPLEPLDEADKPDIENIADLDAFNEAEDTGLEEIEDEPAPAYKEIDLSTEDFSDIGEIEPIEEKDGSSLEAIDLSIDFPEEDFSDSHEKTNTVQADKSIESIDLSPEEDGFEGMDLSTESGTPQDIDLSSEPDDLESFDLSSEAAGLENMDISPLSDGPESIDLSSEVEDSFETSQSPDFSQEDNTAQGAGFADIDIPEIDEHTAFAIDDNVLNTEMGGGMDDFSVPESFIQFSPDKNFKFFDSKKPIDEEEYEGKIPLSISEEDYDHLIERISSFPLNFRIELEDYLVNVDDSELNKMEIVHLIVNDVSLKRIVNKLEGILDKSIPIPRGFDKKSYEEYEKEKRSFKYRFVHKILPAAILTTVVLGFVFSIFVLVWQFIYKPVVAEGFYKEGMTYINSSQYERAIKSFDEAGSYKKKRKWYFRFANAFREKKQFLSAEAIYERLLFDFNHDRQGGIEYADMLSTDLRNYEKAEKVLRRGVLDYHVNDQNALLALGDVYLDWADEDSEKYEEARKTYVSLINLYGAKDVFSGRMMRYFIRTDNLAEVLPLKDHFLNKKLPNEDLIELSGYLLEKRYEPKPTDSENLIGKIEDLRELLEKSIKNSPESPEANYNMGRFFLHNQKNTAAKDYLVNAINLYEDSIKMTPKRTIRQIDSMRLYGELIAEEKLYNEAQEIYAKALAKYEVYTAQKGIYPSPVVGKLYADYGDISYFIAGDYDEALDAYEHAVRELNDSPSIRYRMGYIHYQKENYPDAMKAMTLAYTEKPDDRNLLYGFGNVLFKYTNYFAAQAYYERLMELLEAEKIRKGIIFPQTRVDHAEFVEDYMHTSNNLAVVLNRIAVQNGDSNKNGRALSLFGESTRAWDALNRNPETMIRAKTINLAYANIQNMVKPRSAFTPEIYSDIPKTLENEKILQQTEDR